MDQLPGLRMDECQAEAEHRDVDDFAVSPHRRWLAVNVAEAGPCGRPARCSSAVFHCDPSRSLIPSMGGSAKCLCWFDQMRSRLGADENVAHDTQDGGDGLLRLGEPDEF